MSAKAALTKTRERREVRMRYADLFISSCNLIGETCDFATIFPEVLRFHWERGFIFHRLFLRKLGGKVILASLPFTRSCGR